MAARSALTLVLVALLLASCGDSSEPADQATDSGGTSAAQRSTEDAERRAGRLLDKWSDQLVRALLVARDRGEAAQAGDRDAYEEADAKLPRND
jgi:hypothetical protein